MELEALYRMNDGEGRLYEAVEGQFFEKFTLPFFTVPEPAAYSGTREYSFMRMHGRDCVFDSISETLERFAEIGGFSPRQRYPRIDNLDWMEHDGTVRIGQVIEVAYDDSRLRVLASSLADYLDTLVARVSSGPDEGTMPASDRRIDRDFPHQVAILAPEGGLVARLMAMHSFCTKHAMPYNYKTRADLQGRDPPSRYFRFCFADPAHADAFMAEFGGQRITIEPH